MTDKVVISIGGSILIPGNDDGDYIGELAKLLNELSSKVDIAVVCGGGKTARYYSSVSASLGGDTYEQDLFGITATRMNAGLLDLALGYGNYPYMPKTVSEAASRCKKGEIVVMGGTEPGHTTDGVAAMLAKEIGADRIVNATSVDAVYSDDPKTNGDAERYSEITIEMLEELVYEEHGASKSGVFDPLGVKIAKENSIDILMVHGRDLEDLRSAILGNKIKGTFVNSH
ncbi:MAG TPA: UMP kinase [Candidatus Methanomethylophilaceae archaeon]|nr:UMP kinase [Candidatus Methanomethylophilaceae archaeon]